MSEMDYQLWNLVLNAFTAVGTVGAVVISLYVTTWPKQKFKIHDVKVNLDYIFKENGDSELIRSTITFDIENKCDVQMQVFDLHLVYISKGNVEVNNIPSGHFLPFKDSFIPAKSRYHAATSIPYADLPRGAMDNVKAIKLCLGTSFGEKTLDLPQNWMSNYKRAIEKDEAVVSLKVAI